MKPQVVFVQEAMLANASKAIKIIFIFTQTFFTIDRIEIVNWVKSETSSLFISFQTMLSVLQIEKKQFDVW